MMCSPVSLFNRILGAKGAGKDVRHKIYDELHAGSPWQLFLLSRDLDEIAEDPASTLRIILMSATMETPIFKAVLEAVRRAVPLYEHNHLRVTHPDAHRNPEARTHYLSDECLPLNFNKIRMQQQVAHCIAVMVDWAKSKDMSAAILVFGSW